MIIIFSFDFSYFFFFNDTATTEIYTLSLHDALPIWLPSGDHTKLVTPFCRFVTRRGSPPPSGNIHTWVLGASPVDSPGIGRADRNAIAFPSGLQRGLFDDCTEVVNKDGSCDPSAGTVQIALYRRFSFRSMVPTTKATVAPSGES